MTKKQFFVRKRKSGYELMYSNPYGNTIYPLGTHKTLKKARTRARKKARGKVTLHRV